MRRRPATLLPAIGALILLVLVIGWAARFHVARSLVDRQLARARVPASYRLTNIGPRLERMEDVRIGDPAHPDLVARRIDVVIGYGWRGPEVRGIVLDGVRLRAALDRDGLHLGALDRLMPETSGGRITLPDLDITLRDAMLALATPNGAFRALLAGGGNPAERFAGRARIAAAGPLRLAACTLNGATADLRVTATAGVPHVAGPVGLAAARCPGIRLGAGSLAITATASRTFDRVSLRADPAGFGGRAGPATFASVDGPVRAAGSFGKLHLRATLRIAGLDVPDAARAVTGWRALLAGTPIAPTGEAALDAVARLLRNGAVTADLASTITGEQAGFRLNAVTLTGTDGAWARATARGGMAWSAAGWRADADLASGGGALPALRLRLSQAGVGAPLSARGALAPYRVDAGQIALTPLRLDWDGRTARVDAVARIDGPFGGGNVRGLVLPVRGRVAATGALSVGAGCQPVAFRALALGTLAVDGGRLSVCGNPILSRRGAGAIRVAATIAPLRLTGRTASGTPIALGTGGPVRLTRDGFAATALDATVGEAAHPTRLTIATLAGQWARGTIGGRFQGARGTIGTVPLLLSDAGGDWRFAGATLDLTGDLRISDAAAAPRFLPLDGDDVRLRLHDALITAAATLREPRSHADIVAVRVTHDLSSGLGHAALDMPGIRFVPKHLQPEMLTPLTLGVIANVAGTMSGAGRIDWSGAGVTSSSGTFRTDAMDLAAAFGPVKGISGRIVFTDLLGLVSAPRQEARIAEINPGVAVPDGVVHYHLTGQNRVAIEDATWPFATGTLRLEPTMLAFDTGSERRLTFRVEGADAAHFVQQMELPNLAATGTFDGVLPMIFDQRGGRIEGGVIAARGGGTLAYIGNLTNADIGTMGKLAFDALKAIRYSALDIEMNGPLDGEMVSRVRFTGVHQETGDRSLVARMIRNLPFRFTIGIRAPFRGLVGTARSYADPRLLLDQVTLPAPASPPPAIQPPASRGMR